MSMKCRNVLRNNFLPLPKYDKPSKVTVMINKLIDKNIAFLQRYIQCDEDTVEVYRYSLNILYSYIIDVVVLMSLSIILHKVVETIISILIFAILQVYGGGYHANTKLGCFIITVIGWFIGMFGLTKIVSINYLVSIIIMAISTVLIFVFTPVLNKKHPVGGDVYIRSKKIVRVAVIGIDILTLLCLNLGWNYILKTISTVVILYSVSLIFAVHKSKKR